MDQVGKPKHEVPGTKYLAPNTSPHDLIQEWIKVYGDLGGREGLAQFARDNPIKFYDQLMRLLVAMEAPKQAMKVTLALESLSQSEIESLPTNELKKRLMASMTAGNVVEGVILENRTDPN